MGSSTLLNPGRAVALIHEPGDPGAAPAIQSLLEAEGVGCAVHEAGEDLRGALVRSREVLVMDVNHWDGARGRLPALGRLLELRQQTPMFVGPVVLVSFLRRGDVLALPGGEVLDFPGTTFVRLPVRGRELADILRGLEPLTDDELRAVVRRLDASATTERVRAVRHRAGGVLAAPLAAARGLARLKCGEEIDPATLNTPLAVLTKAWPGLDERLTALAAEADRLLVEATDLGLVGEPAESTFRAHADDALRALQQVVELAPAAARLMPEDVRAILAAGRQALERLEAMRVMFTRLGDAEAGPDPR